MFDPNTLSRFVGPKNNEKYLRKFAKFMVGDMPKFTGTWHWPAFFVAEFWFFYRKMYLWGALALAIKLFGGGLLNITSCTVFGLTGNFLYLKHARKQISDIHSISLNRASDQPEGTIVTINEDTVNQAIEERGGTHNGWVVFILVFLVLTAAGGYVVSTSDVVGSYQIRHF